MIGQARVAYRCDHSLTTFSCCDHWGLCYCVACLTLINRKVNMDIDKLILEVYICVLLWNQVNPNATTFELVSENKFSLIQTM